MLGLCPFFILMTHVLCTVSRSGAEHKPWQDRDQWEIFHYSVFSIYSLPKLILVFLSSQDILQKSVYSQAEQEKCCKVQQDKKIWLPSFNSSLFTYPFCQYSFAASVHGHWEMLWESSGFWGFGEVFFTFQCMKLFPVETKVVQPQQISEISI